MRHDANAGSGAGASAGARRLPRLRFHTRPDPEDVVRVLGPTYAQLPFVVLVMGDLTQRDDPRPIEERMPLNIGRDNFDKRMSEQKLVVEVAAPFAGGAKVAVRFRRLADFEPDSLAQQLASMLPAFAVPAALAAVFADPRVASLERTWRSIRVLVEQAGEHAGVELVNSSATDLDMDFDDSPELRKSGMWRLVHQYNHLGIRPFSAVVLADDLGPHAHRLRDIGEIAWRGSLVVLMDTAEPLAFKGCEAWEGSEAARFVGRCAPRFVAAPAHLHRPRLESQAAFVAAALMLRSHAQTLTGCHFAAEDLALPGVQLGEARDGTVALAAGDAGVRVVRDDACHPGGDAHDRSLSLLMLGNRVIHEALNVQWKRGLYRGRQLDIVEGINRGLATRLEGTGLVARVEPVPQPEATLCLPFDLTVQLPGDGAPSLTRRLHLPDSD